LCTPGGCSTTRGHVGAIENAAGRVAPGGLFALAIYNDQGKKSEIWKKVKKLYCHTPRRLRGPLFFPIPLPGSS